MTKLLDLLVDRGVLLDIGVGLRDVGLGLIVVVVRDEVDDRVVGEHLAHLAGDLGGESLVRLHDEGGLVHGLDGLGHGERLAGTRDAHEGLVAKALLHTLRQSLDRLGLIACGVVGRGHGQGHVTLLDAEALELRTETLSRNILHESSHHLGTVYPII